MSHATTVGHEDNLEPITTVRLTRHDIVAAARVLALLTNDDRMARMFEDANRPVPELAPLMTREELVERARKAFVRRRRRARFFGPDLFGEPAWDMLLALYVTEPMGPRNTIGRLVKYADLSATTAIRWINALEEGGLITRSQHPTDQRSVHVELTDHARRLLDSYFSETILSEV